MTPESFNQKLYVLMDDGRDRDLLPFLLALYPSLQKHVFSLPSLNAVMNIIESALSDDPIEVKSEWLSVSEAPSGNRLSRKFTNPDVKNMNNPNIDKNSNGMEFTYEVLRFQISELSRMAGKQLENEWRSMGVISDTGHDWYNFTALSVMECGINCMIDNGDNLENLDWSIIGRLLEDGRVYE